MSGWLAYGGAFLCGVGVFIAVFMIAFTAVMSGWRVSGPVFIMVVMMAPVITGFAAFGLSFGAFSQQWLSKLEWLYAGAFVAVVATGTMGLAFVDNMPEQMLVICGTTILAVGGAVLFKRRIRS